MLLIFLKLFWQGWNNGEREFTKGTCLKRCQVETSTLQFAICPFIPANKKDFISENKSVIDE